MSRICHLVWPFHNATISSYKRLARRGPPKNVRLSRYLNVIIRLSNIGKRNGAVLFKCSDGTGLWISQMKRVGQTHCTDADNTFHVPPIKLPSTLVLPKDVVEALPCISEPSLYVPFGERPSTFQEVFKHHKVFVSEQGRCVLFDG